MKWFLLLPLFCVSFVSAQCCFNSEIDVVGEGGNFRGGGGVYGWSPLKQARDRLLFAQGGGGYFRHQGMATLGVGYRQCCAPKFAYGINGFADLSLSEHGFTRGQLGGGFELFTCRALFRCNGYAPIGNHHTFFSEPGVATSGTSLIGLDLTRFEVALPGFDLEAGGVLSLGGGELWGYAGYFWHKRGDIRPVQGPRLRGEYRFNSRKLRAQVVVGGSWENDRIRGSTVSAQLEIRFPIGQPASCPPSLCNLMGRPVFRDRSLWLEDFAASRQTGQIGTLIFANNTIDGIGTQTNPATIDNAFTIAGPSDVIFILQDTGNPTPAAPLTLQSFQQVLGFGDASSVDLKVANGATLTINDLTGAGRGVVTGNAGLATFVAAPSTLFRGIGADGGSGAIVLGAAIGDVHVDDVILTNQTVASIDSLSGGSLTVTSSQITGTAIGIREMLATGILDVFDTTITVATGIELTETSLTRALISNTNIAATATGVDFNNVAQGPYVVSRSRLSGMTNGVLINETSVLAQPKDVRILNNEMAGVTLRGIDVSGSEAGSVYVFSGNTIEGPSDEAINLDLDFGTHNIEISNNSLTSFTDGGILVNTAVRTTLLMEGNQGVVANELIDVDFSGGAGDDGFVTLLNNNHLNAPPAFNSYRVDRSSGTAPVCATLLGNNRVVTTMGILIDSNATPLEVFDLPNLSASNNNLDVLLLPTVVNTTTRCPLPDIPPLPFPVIP